MLGIRPAPGGISGSVVRLAIGIAVSVAGPAAAAVPTIVVAGVVASASAEHAGAQRNTDGIPERIADSTFWRMVTEFSEPDGEFAPSQNFVSNENEWQYVIPRALTRVSPGGVYVGVGPEQNFTYIAALQPRIAFICDIRRQNLVQHLMYKALFALSADRADMLARLWARRRPPGLSAASSPAEMLMAYRAVAVDTAWRTATVTAMLDRLVRVHGFALTSDDSSTLRHVYDVFTGAGPDVNYASGERVARIIIGGDSVRRFIALPAFARPSMYATFASLMLEDDGTGVNRGWMGTERAFASIKNFQARNLVVPVVGDFAGPKALRAIGAYLQERSAPVTTFYASNVEQYLFQAPNSWRLFYANVAALPIDSTAIFIRSVTANYRLVAPQKVGSRMAQLTSSIADILRAVQDGAVRSYPALIELRDR